MPKLTSDKNTRNLVKLLRRNHPDLEVRQGSNMHLKIQAPGLPMVTLSASPGRDQSVAVLGSTFKRLGYKVD